MINRSNFLIVALVCPALSGYAADTESVSYYSGVQLAQYSADSDSTLEIVKGRRSYGPVREKEDLWDIARNFKVNYVSMSQVVMAIFHANPHAFTAGNINRLKINVELQIPSEEEIRATSHREAYKEVRAQIVEYEAYLAEKQGKNLTESAPATAVVSTSAAANLVEAEEIVEITQELEAEEAQVLADPVPSQQQASKRPLFRYSYDLSVANDSNIRNAHKDIDIRDDIVADASFRARGGTSVSNLSLITYGVRLNYEAFKTFDTLNNVNFDFNAKYRFAFAGNFSSPIYSVGVKLGGIDSESVMRTSTLFSTSLQMTKWLTDAINMTLGLEHRVRESKSVVFDTTDNLFFMNFDLDLTKTDLLYGTFSFVTGDIVSSGTPDIYIINAADAIEPDDAFGGIANNQFAYRLQGDTNVFTLGYNRIMTRKISLDLSYRYVDSEADGGIVYNREIIRFSLLGRF
jgi:FimV-like protein